MLFALSPANRTPVTLQTFPYPILLYIPFIYLAYLARREGTFTLRLLVFPIALCGIISAAWRFAWTIEELGNYNWGHGEHLSNF